MYRQSETPHQLTYASGVPSRQKGRLQSLAHPPQRPLQQRQQRRCSRLLLLQAAAAAVCRGPLSHKLLRAGCPFGALQLVTVCMVGCRVQNYSLEALCRSETGGDGWFQHVCNRESAASGGVYQYSKARVMVCKAALAVTFGGCAGVHLQEARVLAGMHCTSASPTMKLQCREMCSSHMSQQTVM
jgi:hypothetical protein